MGNSKSKKQEKEPDKFFEREKWRKHQNLKERKKMNIKDAKRKAVVVEPSAVNQPLPAPRPAPSAQRSYDEEALERMRYQLNNDSDAFLLNNILLSVQFFENYEREIGFLKDNPVSDWDSAINDQMVLHNKHVFVADKLHELVHQNVRIKRSSENDAAASEPLGTQRMFVIYDNIEASEPGDNSDYSSVLDAPVYKVMIENCKELGFVKLKKLEVLEGVQVNQSENEKNNVMDNKSDFSDSEKESSDEVSDDEPKRGEELLLQLRLQIEEKQLRSINEFKSNDQPNIRPTSEGEGTSKTTSRRPSGPLKTKRNLLDKQILKLRINTLEETEDLENNTLHKIGDKPKRNNSKNSGRRLSGPVKQKERNIDFKAPKLDITKEEGETSGYGTNSSAYNESSGTDSDYGYSTITELTTPRKIQRTYVKNNSSTGVVPEKCWVTMKVKSEAWSDDCNNNDDENDPSCHNTNFTQLYSTHYYLNSTQFMGTFVDHFITELGKSLGLTSDSIDNALTQGASIYCDTLKHNSQMNFEVIPAIIISWPSVAYEWIIRERRIIQNPKTNFSYQWPTKYMVNKARGLGAILIPVGFRPKRGGNPEESIQWKVVFPAVERYLETCLAHSQVRCYMFTIALVRFFLENETSKIGIDASHIKNHLFWECEDNYARWPEDRLGETLRLFLRSLYKHLSQSRFPDYFIEDHNTFKNIPKNMLLKIQRKLADILESPVMHILHSIHRLKYVKKTFYPQLDCLRLYNILTSKNVMRLLNPNLPETAREDSGNESENEFKEADISFWDKAKFKDKNYQFRKEQHRQAQAKRRLALAKTKKEAGQQSQEIDPKVILPSKMDADRRRLVLEFFIPHFISMAIQSERFEALKQGIIYLEHAQRLTILLSSQPSGEIISQDYSSTIRVKLNEFKIKLADIKYKLPHKRLSVKLHNFQRTSHPNQPKSKRPDYANLHAMDSPPVLGAESEHKLAFVDIHTLPTNKLTERVENKLILSEEEESSDQESKL